LARDGHADLAAVLGVNTNTVLRSLRLLRTRHLGRRDAGAGSRRPACARARRVRPSQGYRVDELVNIIEDVG
jgi:hypothetical protein